MQAAPCTQVHSAPMMCWACVLQSEVSQCHCPGRAPSPGGTDVTTRCDERWGLRGKGADVRTGAWAEPRKIRKSSPPGRKERNSILSRGKGPRKGLEVEGAWHVWGAARGLMWF